MGENGNAGTISRALIEGLKTGNVDLVKAAAAELAGNASDVNSNNHAFGSAPSPTPVAPADQPHHNLAEIGAIFNDASTQLIGGVSPATNKAGVLADLHAVQDDLTAYINAHPHAFQGLTGVHANEIVHQLTLEIQGVNAIGTDPTAPKLVNDIHRDIIDIVQGDDALLKMATKHDGNGFANLPDLLNPPTPFQDNAAQTAFLTKFIADSSSLANKALDLIKGGDGDKGHGDNHIATAALIDQIQSFATKANDFSVSQGGVFSARFNNELVTDGVAGVAAHDLIDGLKTHNVAEVRAAAAVLVQNAADAASNNTPVTGGIYNVPEAGGPPDPHVAHHDHHLWG